MLLNKSNWILRVVLQLTPRLLMLQVMPTQDSFQPMLYLAIMHGDTSLLDLKTGQQNLHFEVSERTGQLKDLVISWTASKIMLLRSCRCSEG